MKTSELNGAALDWAVDEAQGYGATYLNFWNMGGDKRFTFCEVMRHYSGHWDQGGPIIEREFISTSPRSGYRPVGVMGWEAHRACRTISEQHRMTGLTPLIAAMRCYVASKLGDEVEIPKELKGE